MPIGRTDRSTRHQYINDCAVSILLFLALVYPALEGQGAGLACFWCCDIPTQAQTNMPPAYVSNSTSVTQTFAIRAFSSHWRFLTNGIVQRTGLYFSISFFSMQLNSTFNYTNQMQLEPSPCMPNSCFSRYMWDTSNHRNTVDNSDWLLCTYPKGVLKWGIVTKHTCNLNAMQWMSF